ncbi:hypothetical protein CCACVL1_25896, partial [Corchorus capsularis]
NTFRSTPEPNRTPFWYGRTGTRITGFPSILVTLV